MHPGVTPGGLVDETATRARLLLLEEMMRELYRRDIVTDDILDEVASRLSASADRVGGTEAEIAEHAAHMATMLPIEAAAPSQSDWEAERRRARMRIVPDGGNSRT